MRERTPKPDPLIGADIAGRFTVERRIGTGAMGSVYAAHHRELGRPYAIKFLHESIQSDAMLAERFRREARAISRLDHPNIVTIADFGHTPSKQLYLVMEYVEGPSLQDVLEELAPAPLPLGRTCSIVAQLGQAAGAAHAAGVVHRDLKPENILLTASHEAEDVVKILDFGLAKIMDGAELTVLTTQGEVFGTADYMAPEQARGEEIDHRVDLYSLGVIAYELCTGRPPFTARSIPQLLMAHQDQPPDPPSNHRPSSNAPLPAEVERIILQCLEKAPSRRPARADDVAAIFSRFAKARVAHTRVVPPVTVAAPAEPDDWNEVTLEMGGDFPTEPDPLSNLDAGHAQAARREWIWSQAIKVSRELTQQLGDQRLGTVDLIRQACRLSDVEERVLSLETEVALARSRLTDLDAMVRDAEARLRYAVVDLSMERGRLQDEGASANVYADLDFQIRSLEQRLANLYDKNDENKASLLTALRARMERLEYLRQDQTHLEVQLINGVIASRPAQTPDDIAESYDRLTDLLATLKAITNPNPRQG